VPTDRVCFDISVVIPVLDETQTINTTIRNIRSQETDFQGTIEVVVVDGDPAGQTCSAIEDLGVIRLLSEAGRAKQMNKGASVAQGNVLLFLHADTRLQPGSLQALYFTMKDQRYAGGAFDLHIDARGMIFRVMERVSSFRSRLTRIPYGDQGIFIRRDVFERINGYPEVPIMEDVWLMRRLKTAHYEIGFPKAKAITSARRWQEEGLIYATLRNWTLIALYMIGVSPFKLARFYRNVRKGTE
jgi:rSAM/selenodomain-associated transferase 2